MTRANTHVGSATAEWLARAHDDPAAARHGWEYDRMAVLPIGARFDAVRVPVEIVHAAVGTQNRAAVGPLLEAALDGPVIQDGHVHTYALVPVGGAPDWVARTGTYLGRGWLVVPRTDRLAPPGQYWSSPMREAGQLCDLGKVAALVEAGFRRLAGEVLS